MLNLKKTYRINFEASFKSEGVAKLMFANFTEANKVGSTTHFYAVVIRQSIAKDLLEQKICKSIEVSTEVTQRNPFSAIFSMLNFKSRFNLQHQSNKRVVL